MSGHERNAQNVMCAIADRDGFFYLMKEWEQRHTDPDWSLGTHQASRIRDMFDIIDLAAHLHFSRLFVAQLITVC